jgi:hypothetical protein
MAQDTLLYIALTTLLWGTVTVALLTNTIMASPKQSSEDVDPVLEGPSMNPDNMELMPLLDPRGSAGTGRLGDDEGFSIPSLAPEVKHPPLPYIPPEIQQIIGDSLDQVTSAAALQGGLSLSKATYRRAQHAYIWSKVLKKSDFDTVAKVTQSKGNVYLIGHGLRSLYNSSHGISKHSSSPIQLLLSWYPRDRLLLNMRRFTGPKARFSDPDILLQAGAADTFARIHVNDIGGLIVKEDGKLYTSIIYFRDE